MEERQIEETQQETDNANADDVEVVEDNNMENDSDSDTTSVTSSAVSSILEIEDDDISWWWWLPSTHANYVRLDVSTIAIPDQPDLFTAEEVELPDKVPAPDADSDDDAPLMAQDMAIEPYKEKEPEENKPEEAIEPSNDWNDWKDKKWDNDWKEEKEEVVEDKMSPAEKKMFEEVLRAQATREDILRILQFPSQQLVDDQNLTIRSRDEAIIDLFVRFHVNWDGQDKCLLGRAEGFEDSSATYLVQPATSGKSKAVNLNLRVRRGNHVKTFAIDIMSNHLIKEEEFRCYYDWLSEEETLPTLESIATAKRQLEYVRNFAFDTGTIETLITNGKASKLSTTSQRYRISKSNMDSIRSQHKQTGSGERTRDLLQEAEKNFDDANETYLQRKDMDDRNNKRAAVTAVNKRNMLKQQGLDRTVATANKHNILNRGQQKINPFSRRDCKPVVMWDVGKGAETALLNAPILEQQTSSLDAALKKRQVDGFDKDLYVPPRMRRVDLNSIAPTPLQFDEVTEKRRNRMVTNGQPTAEDSTLRTILDTFHNNAKAKPSRPRRLMADAVTEPFTSGEGITPGGDIFTRNTQTPSGETDVTANPQTANLITANPLTAHSVRTATPDAVDVFPSVRTSASIFSQALPTDTTPRETITTTDPADAITDAMDGSSKVQSATPTPTLSFREWRERRQKR